MDPGAESAFRPAYAEDDEDKKNWARPPSSYGSMKSDSDDVDEYDENDVELMEEEEQKEEQEQKEERREEEECNQEVAKAFVSPPPEVHPPSPILQRDVAVYEGTGMQLVRSESPETLYTMTTQQTKPPGALVIDTRSSDIGSISEDDDKDLDEPLDPRNDSPEPPEPLEFDDGMQMDEYGQPGMLHPEQDLAYIFKTIQNCVTELTREELLQFKMWFSAWEKQITLQHMMEGDVLDFVDRIIEVLGMDRALTHTIHTLEGIKKLEESEQLEKQCKRALLRLHLKQHLERLDCVYEGVSQAGKKRPFDDVYVEPPIAIGFYGGFEPSHELRPQPPIPVQVPNPDTFVSVNNVFRLKKQDGQPVRTVVTTGVAGIGLTLCLAKFCLDWINKKANKDVQFIFKLPFCNVWLLRNDKSTQQMSIMELIDYYHCQCKELEYLDAEDCKYLIILESFDRYQAQLDWKNTPVVTDANAKEDLDVLIVNLIRGNLLPNALIWIVGRRAAISQLPSEFLDVVTEIQGFTDEMKDEYFTKFFSDNAQLGAQVVAQYKTQPTLRILAYHPFMCWTLATMFKHQFRDENYGSHPPRITPFYLSMLVIQMNRRLQFYFGHPEHRQKWRDEDRQLVIKLGKMALKMLDRNVSVFSQDDLKEYSLNVQDVTVFMGIVTELPTSSQKRMFSFVHFTFQEFMAALYVFKMFRDKVNVLESTRSKFFPFKDSKSAASLIQPALDQTLNSPLNQYDMFLRFLCGLLHPSCSHLNGCLFQHRTPAVPGIEEAAKLLETNIDKAPVERLNNLKECLREMIQTDV